MSKINMPMREQKPGKSKERKLRGAWVRVPGVPEPLLDPVLQIKPALSSNARVAIENPDTRQVRLVRDPKSGVKKLFFNAFIHERKLTADEIREIFNGNANHVSFATKLQEIVFSEVETADLYSARARIIEELGRNALYGMNPQPKKLKVVALQNAFERCLRHLHRSYDVTRLELLDEKNIRRLAGNLWKKLGITKEVANSIIVAFYLIIDRFLSYCDADKLNKVVKTFDKDGDVKKLCETRGVWTKRRISLDKLRAECKEELDSVIAKIVEEHNLYVLQYKPEAIKSEGT